MLRVLLLIFCSGFFLAGSGQDKPLPEELKAFLLPGFEALDFLTGDLNGEKKPDAVLIQRIVGEDTLLEDDYTRSLLMLTRQPNGKLKQVVRNDSAVLCRRCGGVFGDPYQSMSLNKDGFSIFFYGGSAWRWAYEYRFAWKPLRRNWLLVYESQSSFNSTDPQMTIKESNISESELGQITLDKFNATPGYDDSRWKVKAVKTYFYDSPQSGSKPRKGYLVKGNVVTGIRQLKNFIEVSFEGKNAVYTTGYILRKDLQQIK